MLPASKKLLEVISKISSELQQVRTRAGADELNTLSVWRETEEDAQGEGVECIKMQNQAAEAKWRATAVTQTGTHF